MNSLLPSWQKPVQGDAIFLTLNKVQSSNLAQSSILIFRSTPIVLRCSKLATMDDYHQFFNVSTFHL